MSHAKNGTDLFFDVKEEYIDSHQSFQIHSVEQCLQKNKLRFVAKREEPPHE